MGSTVKSKFIKKYWFDIIQSEKGFYIFNTQRRRNQVDRDGIGYIVSESYFDTLDEAINYLENYEKLGYDV